MATTVVIQALHTGRRTLTVHAQASDDGAGGAVILINKSDHTILGVEPSKLAVTSCQWSGTGQWTLTFDRSGGTVHAMTLASGAGEYTFPGSGGVVDVGTGNTGDITLTPTTPAAGNKISVHLTAVKKV